MPPAGGKIISFASHLKPIWYNKYNKNETVLTVPFITFMEITALSPEPQLQTATDRSGRETTAAFSPGFPKDLIFMNSLLNFAGAAIALLFIAAVFYSLLSTMKKRRNEGKAKKELSTKQHVVVTDLHQYDIQPKNGYYRYDIEETTYVKRFPRRFTAISLELASNQPYSICLIGFAEYEDNELKDQHYFYVRPPENDLSMVQCADLTWESLSKADEFGEYWRAGMNRYFENTILVAHNAPFVMGCIFHALKIYGIEAPVCRFIDTLEIARKSYHFTTNTLESICSEMDIDVERHNSLSEAAAIGQFLLLSHQDYPVSLPRICYLNGTPTETEIMAAAVAAVEREEETAAVMFAPLPSSPELLQRLLDKNYITAGKKADTYYATDEGLDFSESVDKGNK